MGNLSDHFEVEFLEPRLIRLKPMGEFGSDIVNQLFDQLDQYIADQPFWLLEVDLSELGHADPSARKTGVERIGQTPDYSMAFYGGRLAQRTIATLFLRLAQLFNRSRDVKYTFAKSQSEARQWLEAETERRLLRVSRPDS